MVKENFEMSVIAIGNDEGTCTYEIVRNYNNEGKKSLVIGLYPTISANKAVRMDLTTMHLTNHIEELGLGSMRIVNLYSNVCDGKPTVTQLNGFADSLTHIEEILEQEDIRDYEIVIAWGTALSNHIHTTNLKIDILNMLMNKGLRASCISAERLFVEKIYGVHPLYLGLHHGKERWELIEYPIEDELNKLNQSLKLITTKEIKSKKSKKGAKKNVSAT